MLAIRAISSRCGPTCGGLRCLAAVCGVKDQALLLAEMRSLQYQDSGFRRNDGPKAGASLDYFVGEVYSLRFDRLSANGGQAQRERWTGSARTVRQAQRER